MKRNFISRLLLLVAFLTILYSCRNDHFPEQETYNNIGKFNLTSKTISLNESKHRSKLVSELGKAETQLKSQKTDASGKVVNYGNGVSIDTDNVIYIENGPNYHTYTFRINRENAPADAPVENLLLVPLPDGSYRELLVIYNLTEQEKVVYLQNKMIDPKKVKTVELTKGTYNVGGELAKTSCGYINEIVWQECSEHVHNQYNTYDWDNCKATVKPDAYIVTSFRCWEEQDDVITTTPIDGGTSGGGGGSGNTSGGGGATVPPCDTSTIPSNPEPGLTDENGCPIGTPTLPNLPNPKTTPCNKLKDLLDPTKANIKPLIVNGMYSFIDNIGNQESETGIYFKRSSTGNITSEIAPPSGDNTLPPKYDDNYYCAIHTHPPDTSYPMFSYNDIYNLYTLEIHIATHNTGLSSFILVCEDDNGVKQTYAIVFENTGLMMEDVWSKPEFSGCTKLEIIAAMNAKYKDYYEKEEKGDKNYERAFLRINFGTNIGLYKANSDLTSWSKLYIDTDSETATVKSTNCN